MSGKGCHAHGLGEYPGTSPRTSDQRSGIASGMKMLAAVSMASARAIEPARASASVAASAARTCSSASATQAPRRSEQWNWLRNQRGSA